MNNNLNSPEKNQNLSFGLKLWRFITHSLEFLAFAQRTKNTIFFWLIAFLFLTACKTNPQVKSQAKPQGSYELQLAASRFDLYVPQLAGKKVGFVGNQASVIPNTKKTYTHVIDTLLSLGVDIQKVFSPEHGFRGSAAAGESVLDGIDIQTGLPVFSLYGVHKKPSKKQLEGLDILLFDLQDVGVRFYTYISTLHYILEAAGQNDLKVIILDRPNPNAHYIDGPVLQEKHRSFVGLHPVPVVYGMTIGEYAQMILGEYWLEETQTCDLQVIPIKNYTHQTEYKLPVKPSPNLPDATAVNLYPSLCFFEGTYISCGRGTDKPFQIFGAPDLPAESFPYTFTPIPNPGAKHPKFQGKVCQGLDLENAERLSEIKLNWLLNAYQDSPNRVNFFNNYFEKLTGDTELREQIKLGYSNADIKKTWQPGIEKFKIIRLKYLLYE